MPVNKLYHKQAALYIRVSSDEQARHGFSLGEQRLDLERYAKEKGYNIIDIYADEGASARKAISRRHELQRLLRDVEAGLVDIIVMKCLDRWMRSVRDFYRIQDILDKHNVALEFTQEQDYNTSTTQGRLMLNLKLSIAQNESDQTSDRIKYVFAGMRRDKKVTCGKVPYGYRIKDKKIVIEPTEAEEVQYIFAEIMRGKSAYSLVDTIYNTFGHEIKYGTLRGILKNKSYTGNMQGVEGLAPAIISKDDFANVQEVLARHPRRKKSDHIYLFSGLIICPRCGRRMCAHRKYCGSKYLAPYYECNNHYQATRKGNISCNFTSAIREERIEKYLVENISRIIADNVRTTKTKMHNKKKSSQTLLKVSRSLERLNEIYVMGNIEKEAYRLRYEALKKQEKILLAETNTKTIKIPTILRGDQFPTIYQTWSQEERRAFWQGLIKSIEFVSDNLIPRSGPIKLNVSFFGL